MTSPFQRKIVAKILSPHGRQAWTELAFCPMARVRSKARRELEETCSNCFQMRISSITNKSPSKTSFYAIHRTWSLWNNPRRRRHPRRSPACSPSSNWWLTISMVITIPRWCHSHSITTPPTPRTKLCPSVRVIKLTSTMRMLDLPGCCPWPQCHRSLPPTCNSRINPTRISSSRSCPWFRLRRTIRRRTFAIGSAIFPTNNRATTTASSRFLCCLRKSSSAAFLASPPKRISMRISIVSGSLKFNGRNCTAVTRNNTERTDSFTSSFTMPSPSAHYWIVVHVTRTTTPVRTTSSISKQPQARERRSKWSRGTSGTTTTLCGKSSLRQAVERCNFSLSLLFSPPQQLDSKKTIFVGNLHGTMTARYLWRLMEDLFSGAVYAGVDIDKYKYPYVLLHLIELQSEDKNVLHF